MPSVIRLLILCGLIIAPSCALSELAASETVESLDQGQVAKAASTLKINGPDVSSPNFSKVADQSERVKDLAPNQQRELVSILKRKLPSQNQPFEVKDAPEWFQSMMQRIVRENIPETYVYDKHWGKTERRWDGLDVDRRGPLKWHTKRKWKDVNHGTWKKYEVTQIDPDKNIKLRIENVRDAGKGKVGFDVRLASQLHVMTRMAKWTKGVQLYSISADADAGVEILLECQVGMKLGLNFPPDVVFTPEVTEADLEIADFRLQKVSKLDGPLVKKLSGSVHRFLLDKLEEKQNKLPEKINKQIAKNQDKMRLSMSEFVAAKKESEPKSASGLKSASGPKSVNASKSANASKQVLQNEN